MFNPEADFAGEVARLRSSLGATRLTVSHESWPGADRIYFSNMRLVRLHQIMSACEREILSLDADSLIMGPLDDLDAAIGPGDLAITTRPAKAEIAQKLA